MNQLEVMTSSYNYQNGGCHHRHHHHSHTAVPENFFPPTPSKQEHHHEDPPPIYIAVPELLAKFGSRVVLEVCGSGGAVWGFSEICGLRTIEPESIRFWRLVALIIAILFAIRLLRQFGTEVWNLLQQRTTYHHGCRLGLGGKNMTAKTRTSSSNATAATASVNYSDFSFSSVSDQSSIGGSPEQQPTVVQLPNTMLLGDIGDDSRDNSLFFDEDDNECIANELTALTPREISKDTPVIV